ncbi:hypothetical protein GH714_013263 [Hevea brasiliensis]|uniref:Uncharacterized protein n=1 Tax=Hevea brasiliensis TaxID=3981 RepID=A0A6A6M8Z0_HEVBR|nr:hypothetical protein GH714_013263 [Hevea brasiliensis]
MGVKDCTEAEMDRESGGSSEDNEESPKSVGKWGRNISNIGFGQNTQLRRVASAVDVVFFSRPILPCSPLVGKPSTKPCRDKLLQSIKGAAQQVETCERKP